MSSKLLITSPTRSFHPTASTSRTPYKSPPLSRTTSKVGTARRGDMPPRAEQSEVQDARSSTPKRQPRGRRREGGAEQQRKAVSDDPRDEDVLMSLLGARADGVGEAKADGDAVIQVPQVSESPASGRTGGRRNRKMNADASLRGSMQTGEPSRTRPPMQEGAVMSEGDIPAQRRRRRPPRNREDAKQDIPPFSKKADGHLSAQPMVADPSFQSRQDPYDVSDLSRSLPAGGLLPRAKKKDAASEWDMPDDGPLKDAQPLTVRFDVLQVRTVPLTGQWQQQLGQSPLDPSRTRRKPSRAPKDTPQSTLTNTKPRTLRPQHTRRHSTDTNPPASQAPSDSHAPTDYIALKSTINALRPPQTPRGRAQQDIKPRDGNVSDLPLLGQFPRGSAVAAETGGGRYAGPGFHNSPAGSSFPKPDISDF